MEIRCPMCGGMEFDRPRNVNVAGWGSLFYMLVGRWPLMPYFQCGKRRFIRLKARACLNCGHVDLVADPDEIRD